jgi:hypothetical protein
MLSALKLSPVLTTDVLAAALRQIEEGRNGSVPAFFFESLCRLRYDLSPFTDGIMRAQRRSFRK